jgi:uncharacterized protein
VKHSHPVSLPVIAPGERLHADPHNTLDERFAKLEELLNAVVRDGLVVAFSGGVDSAFLLWAAGRAAGRTDGSVVALTAVSESMPARDLDDGVQFAEGVGVEHVIEHSAEMQDPEYVRNDADRCYYCKAELFRIAERLSAEHGMRWIAYGYSASDRYDVRPGHQAALESGVLSPLAAAGLDKEDIRTLMRRHRLQLVDKPASPCLSSRIMTGVSITSEQLADVQRMEAFLHSAGVVICRVRVCDAAPGFFLRMEVASEEMAKVLPLRDELIREAKQSGYRWVTLDLAGYRTGGGNA